MQAKRLLRQRIKQMCENIPSGNKNKLIINNNKVFQANKSLKLFHKIVN